MSVRLAYQDSLERIKNIQWIFLANKTACAWQDGYIAQTEILEENNTTSLASFNFEILNFKNFTCPFGLKHEGYNSYPKESANSNKYKYQYNGKEFQDELGLNWNDYGARNYDPAIGRFFNMDNYAEDYRYINSYQYTLNNPVYFVDVNGDCIDINYGNNQTATFCGDINSLSQGALNNDFVAQTVAAYMLLKSSYAAYNEANGTDYSSDFVSLVDSQDHTVGFRSTNKNSSYNATTETILWNPNQGLDAHDKSFSSLVLLEHEGSHANHHQTNPGVTYNQYRYDKYGEGPPWPYVKGDFFEYLKQYKGTYYADQMTESPNSFGEWSSVEENINAVGSETKAAKALGELPKNVNRTRIHYLDGKLNTTGFGSNKDAMQKNIKKIRDTQPQAKQDVQN